MLDRLSRLLLPRWPIVLAAPAFAYADYTGGQVIAFTALVTVLAEITFAVAKVLLLDRE